MSSCFSLRLSTLIIHETAISGIIGQKWLVPATYTGRREIRTANPLRTVSRANPRSLGIELWRKPDARHTRFSHRGNFSQEKRGVRRESGRRFLPRRYNHHDPLPDRKLTRLPNERKTVMFLFHWRGNCNGVRKSRVYHFVLLSLIHHIVLIKSYNAWSVCQKIVQRTLGICE